MVEPFFLYYKSVCGGYMVQLADIPLKRTETIASFIGVYSNNLLAASKTELSNSFKYAWVIARF